MSSAISILARLGRWQRLLPALALRGRGILLSANLLNQERLETRRPPSIEPGIEVGRGLDVLVTERLLDEGVAAGHFIEDELCKQMAELMPSDPDPEMP